MRADAAIELEQVERLGPEKTARTRRTPQAVAGRAHCVDDRRWRCAHDHLRGIGRLLSTDVRKWLARYVEQCLAGLRSEAMSGKPRSLDDQRVADLLKKACQTRPAQQTHWSVRSFAAEANLSKDMANRLFGVAGLQPHFSRSPELSNDPGFVNKVRDITGLYLSPPDHALGLCVAEKSQI